MSLRDFEGCQICGEHVMEFSGGPSAQFRLHERAAYDKAIALSGTGRWWTCWDCWDGMAEQVIGEAL